MAIVNPSFPEQNAELLITEVNGRLDKDNLKDDFIEELKTSNPSGVILQFAGSTAPDGYLICDGAGLSTSYYSDLYNIIGYTYGGAGSTFNLPDLRGRVLVGAGTGVGLTARTLAATGGTETHTLASTEIPSHTHAAGTYTIPDHTHAAGTLAMANHTHGFTPSGTVSSHSHGAGTLQANSGVASNTGSGTAVQRINAALSGETRDITGNTASATPSFTGTAGNTGNPSVTTINGSTAATPSANGLNGSSASTGGGGSHNNLQPFIVVNYIIKT